jgi:hypothetical protein
MKCYLCDTELKEIMKFGHIVEICPNCNHYYIKKKYINSFLIRASEHFKFKNNNLRLIFLNRILLLNKDKNYKIVHDKTICTNISCMKNCSLILYSYNGFKFYFCNLVDYYIINNQKLNTNLYKQKRISLIYYYKEIILKKLKGLFVKE